MKPEQILEEYIKGTKTGADNQLRASIGKLTADRTKELTNAIQALHQQFPITISELRQTISRNTDNLIKSNEKLSKSNEAYAQWIKWLTFALVAVGIASVVVAWIGG